MLKAFGYIERVVKSDFFFGKRPCFHHSCATWNEQPSNIKTMVYIKFFSWTKFKLKIMVNAYYLKYKYYFFLKFELKSDPELDPDPNFCSRLSRIQEKQIRILIPVFVLISSKPIDPVWRVESLFATWHKNAPESAKMCKNVGKMMW